MTVNVVICKGCNQMICPHCGAVDSIEVEASVLISHRTRYVDGTLTILPAEASWDSYESMGYVCKICAENVVIPKSIEIDDNS